MICSKCGQELKEGAKFCTKCGTSFKETMNVISVNLALPIASIVLSVIGIIGLLVTMFQQSRIFFIFFTKINFSVFYNSSFLLVIIGILLALIAQNKQKSLIGFIAGLIPCAYLIIMHVYYIVGFIRRF